MILVLELPLVSDGRVLSGVLSGVVQWVVSGVRRCGWVWTCGEVRPKAWREYHVEVVLCVPVRLRLLRATFTVLPYVDELLEGDFPGDGGRDGGESCRQLLLSSYCM